MKIEKIIVHALDTFPVMDVGLEFVRRVHVTENGWRDVGYHYIIRRDGTIELGRRCEANNNYVPGAHVLGLNQNSLGIAMAGGKARKGGHPVANFTFAQYRTLERMYWQLSNEYPDAEWDGHYAADPSKVCPGFDVKALLGLI